MFFFHSLSAYASNRGRYELAKKLLLAAAVMLALPAAANAQMTPSPGF
jgi:hypothetical protein